MLTDEHFEDLRLKGYTVVKDVLKPEECDSAVNQYKVWLSQFQGGEWPFSVNSLIQRYNTGNMRPSWHVRLKSKKVFSQIWKTDKLLSSIDAVAIGRPPEEGAESFDKPDSHWLHLDQVPSRVGLHAYQGEVYLEDADEDDWTLLAVEGSHLYFEEFFNKNKYARAKSIQNGFYEFTENDISQLEEKGFTQVRVRVPKGAIALWDSRLVHTSASPIKGRKHPGRWRFCVFVSMTPAIWATEEDLKKKREAYSHVCMTSHWSSRGISLFRTDYPAWTLKNVDYPKQLPQIAKTTAAKLISGVLPYNFNDGTPNGDGYIPEWKNTEKVVPAHRPLTSKRSVPSSGSKPGTEVVRKSVPKPESNHSAKSSTKSVSRCAEDPASSTFLVKFDNDSLVFGLIGIGVAVIGFGMFVSRLEYR